MAIIIMLNFNVFYISATFLNPFGKSASTGPIVLALDDDDDDDDDEYGAVGVMMAGRGKQSTQKKPVPLSLSATYLI
jgi:hypothetical protein